MPIQSGSSCKSICANLLGEHLARDDGQALVPSQAALRGGAFLGFEGSKEPAWRTSRFK
jgi:hypothetical protein